MTIDKLKSRLLYDPATGLFVWRVNTGRGIGSIAGSDHHSGYMRVSVFGRQYLAHRLAWFYVHGEWPVGEIDHLNGDKSDNRIANLREATVSQNRANRGPCRNSATGVKGVFWDARNKKWFAQIQVSSKSIWLGYFCSLDAAAAARRKAEAKYQGAFAWNPPEEMAA